LPEGMLSGRWIWPASLAVHYGSAIAHGPHTRPTWHFQVFICYDTAPVQFAWDCSSGQQAVIATRVHAPDSSGGKPTDGARFPATRA
jgi:hypothetical protein